MTSEGRTRHPPRASQAGFTLVEGVIATVVLATGILVLAGALMTRFRANAMVRERTLALTAAEAKMEEVLAQRPRHASQYDDRTFDVPGLDRRDDATPVGLVAFDPVDPVVHIEVLVRWKGAAGDDALGIESAAPLETDVPGSVDEGDAR